MANYQDLRKLCLEIAIVVGPPIFYTEKEESIQQSRMAFEKNETVQKCLGIVAQEGFFAGHAEVHIRNVAIDAGAIVLIEANGSVTYRANRPKAFFPGPHRRRSS